MIGTTAALIMGGLSAAGALGGAKMSSNAAKSAAQTQANAGNQAIDFQREIFGTQQENQRPYMEVGATSIQDIMKAIQSGKFGAGSTGMGDLPTFEAPTLEEARATPGYEFTQQQGNKGIMQGAAAAGGAINGGMFRELAKFNTGLADQTYNDVFNRKMATYGAALQGYNTKLGGQAQEFAQMFAPAQLGQGAVQNINQTGANVAGNVGNLLTQVGNSQSAGTVGSANAMSQGLSGATSGLVQSWLMKYLKQPALPGTGPG